MSDFTRSPKQSTKVESLLVISLMALVLFGACSKAKYYDIIISNETLLPLTFKLNLREIPVDANKIRYFGSFEKANWQYSVTIGSQFFSDIVVLDRDMTFIMSYDSTFNYVYWWE